MSCPRPTGFTSSSTARASRPSTFPPQVTERYQPIAFLKDFNIVDTPGTNTMVAEHQEITENFIPRADLVLFVFSVVNPWGASAWELLRFVNQKWLKNIVFVLQQADLREPAEVKVIEKHLRETANQKLGFAPPIFAVSARKAFLARTTGLDKERLWKESRVRARSRSTSTSWSTSRAMVCRS